MFFDSFSPDRVALAKLLAAQVTAIQDSSLLPSHIAWLGYAASGCVEGHIEYERE